MALTAKQRRFVEEYSVDHNATKAAIRAGYSKRTARQVGSENLSKPVIAAAIAKRQEKLAQKAEWTAADRLRSLRDIHDKIAEKSAKPGSSSSSPSPPSERPTRCRAVTRRPSTSTADTCRC